jgi:hypothetical protein
VSPLGGDANTWDGGEGESTHDGGLNRGGKRGVNIGWVPTGGGGCQQGMKERGVSRGGGVNSVYPQQWTVVASCQCLGAVQQTACGEM